MKKIIAKLLLGVLALSFIIAIANGIAAFRAKNVLKERVEDVAILEKIYRQQSTEPADIMMLLKDLHANGIRLNNPIPRDPSKPCYRIAVGDTNSPPGVLIEETTNVNDNLFIVRGYDDGHVSLDRKN